jgi:tRNA pseudouridine55 synthase|tara:strand:- start:996 stop:1706 length:711 start_codon:yes stop_codon:yes gene_type:complete
MHKKLSNLSKEDFESGVVLLINKEINWTSFDVVKKIKNLLKEKFSFKKIKVGHAGTLDPLATGLLVVCTGKSTKMISEIQNQKKEYTGELTMGATTPSYDLETEIDNRYDISNISESDIFSKTKLFIGEVFQKPPIFSAIKVKGERLYEKARRGEKINIKKRKITIYNFKLTKILLPKIHFIIECSKGTYIRSIAHDFGKSLNNGAHLSKLVRTKIGEFDLKDAKSIIEFENELNQ